MRLRVAEPAPSTVHAVALQLYRATPGGRRRRILELAGHWPLLLARALEREELLAAAGWPR